MPGRRRSRCRSGRPARLGAVSPSSRSVQKRTVSPSSRAVASTRSRLAASSLAQIMVPCLAMVGVLFALSAQLYSRIWPVPYAPPPARPDTCLKIALQVDALVAAGVAVTFVTMTVAKPTILRCLVEVAVAGAVHDRNRELRVAVVEAVLHVLERSTVDLTVVEIDGLADAHEGVPTRRWRRSRRRWPLIQPVLSLPFGRLGQLRQAARSRRSSSGASGSRTRRSPAAGVAFPCPSPENPAVAVFVTVLVSIARAEDAREQVRDGRARRRADRVVGRGAVGEGVGLGIVLADLDVGVQRGSRPPRRRRGSAPQLPAPGCVPSSGPGRP